jgi:hypothetical protein
MAPSPEVGGRVKIALLLLASAASLPAATWFVTVAGLGGEPDYEQRFSAWARDAEKALKSTGVEKVETLHGPAATRAQLASVLARIAREAKAEDALVLTLIGHGTFDGLDYKFNLPGPDVTAAELEGWLDRIRAKRQLVVNTTSASGASLDQLRRPDRVVITATRSGNEKNATVFARYWVEALRDPAADTDKNDTVSALEAFRYADQKTAKFYESQKRLATEHALLEDTGKAEGVRAPSPENGQGLLASAFTVVRFGQAGSAFTDPGKRRLLEKKEELEQKIDSLKYQKAAMPEAEYRKELSVLLLELAKTQAELDK